METSAGNNARDFWDEIWKLLVNASVFQCAVHDCVAVKPKDDEIVSYLVLKNAKDQSHGLFKCTSITHIPMFKRCV